MSKVSNVSKQLELFPGTRPPGKTGPSPAAHRGGPIYFKYDRENPVEIIERLKKQYPENTFILVPTCLWGRLVPNR